MEKMNYSAVDIANRTIFIYFFTDAPDDLMPPPLNDSSSSSSSSGYDDGMVMATAASAVINDNDIFAMALDDDKYQLRHSLLATIILRFV